MVAFSNDKKEYKGLMFEYMTSDDFDNIVTILSKSSVCKYLYFAPCPRENVEAYFLPMINNMQEQLQSEKVPKDHIFIIKKNEIFVGYCALVPVEYSQDNYIIGYTIDDPFWGQQIGTITGEFLVQYAKEKLHARKITGDCFINNLGSQKIMEKLGFVQEGIIKKQYLCDNQFVDNLLYGLLLT